MSKWCIVDIHNNFEFNNRLFIIDEDVEVYKVYNKAGEVEDYTNEAKMEQILAILTNDGNFKFYDQNCDLVKGVSEVITIKK